MQPGDRVLVRPSFHIPVRPWWTESYQSPFYYPGTVTQVNPQRGRAHVELDESLYPTPWRDHIQLFHLNEIHRHVCRCQECAKPGRDIYRYRAEQEDLRKKDQP